VEWYLNFADGDLFFHYGSKLRAQDEHQVAEHPILASVKEMLEELATENSDYMPPVPNFPVFSGKGFYCRFVSFLYKRSRGK